MGCTLAAVCMAGRRSLECSWMTGLRVRGRRGGGEARCESSSARADLCFGPGGLRFRTPPLCFPSGSPSSRPLTWCARA